MTTGKPILLSEKLMELGSMRIDREDGNWLEPREVEMDRRLTHHPSV